MLNNYQSDIIDHYEKVFNGIAQIYLWDKGPFEKLPFDFRILEFPPTETKGMWAYATCCMSQPEDLQKIELHIYSSIKDESIIELLTALAFYHRGTNKIDLNHTVNFGRPWQNKSSCEYGFVSLPYIDGPILEDLTTSSGLVKCYWLIPVSKKEVEFKKKNGVEALESKFDEPSFNFIDPNRASMV